MVASAKRSCRGVKTRVTNKGAACSEQEAQLLLSAVRGEALRAATWGSLACCSMDEGAICVKPSWSTGITLFCNQAWPLANLIITRRCARFALAGLLSVVMMPSASGGALGLASSVV